MNDILAMANKITKITNANALYINEPMKNHTTFKIGGPADLLFIPPSSPDLINVLKLAREYDFPTTIIGNGSNLLVSDKGIRGIVIKMQGGISKISVEGDIITAESGALLTKICSVALKNSLKGLEFASGIPGTLGGAIAMNAGAYDEEMKGIVKRTVFLDENLNERTLDGVEHDFSYRHSYFEGKNYIILYSALKLEKGISNEIKGKMLELNKRRLEKQPLDMPSAGSTFKRPEGYFAAKLIEECGLKGYSVGGACVSKKHSGFIVNSGNATADDVLQLVAHIINTVFEKTDIKIDTEIKFIGES